jgi:predicted ATPase
MKSALAAHDALLRDSIQANGGNVFKTVGDAFYAVFPSAYSALVAALTAQRAIHEKNWEGIPGLRVRMALHTGTAEERDGDYFGPALNRVARLLSAGHGGQTLLSLSLARALEKLPEAVELRDLGERRLKDLSQPERIFQVVVAGLPMDFPPLKTLEAVPNNLPTALTNFVGRAREIAEVKRLLTISHLVTLTGSGGCGKTRLSLQVAADLLDTFSGGLWFVELAALSDPAAVPGAGAAVMGIREDPTKPILNTLAESLRTKTVLLILDNCEHLVGACAELTDSLLRSCPNLRIMASSREALGISGETVWRVPSLSVPDSRNLPSLEILARTEAVRLFCDRAVAVAPAFSLTEQNAPAVAQVCHRLDGIPLAIELAAARVSVLHVDQIAARLNDRFRLLTGGSRTALPRQRTLRAAIDWSYDLLSDPERKLLRRISVFSGDFALEAAETVCVGDEVATEDVLDLISHLVEKSLVNTEKVEHEARYTLLDMVRQYSRDRLLESGEAELMGRRHRDYYVSLAERAVPELTGANQEAWFDRIDQEYENFRSALTWCQSDPEGTQNQLRLVAALSRFWFIRGYFEEARTWLKDTMARAGGSLRTSEWAKALRSAGVVAYNQGDYAAARSLYEESLAIFRNAGDRGAAAATLISLGNTIKAQGDIGLAQSYCEESLHEFRALGSNRGTAGALSALALMVHEQGDNVRALQMLEESLNIFRELDQSDGIAHNLDLLGAVRSSAGDHTLAQTMWRQSLEIHRRMGNKPAVALTLINLGDAAMNSGDLDAAISRFGEGLSLATQLGNRRHIALALHNLGLVALRREEFEPARGQFVKALRIRSEIGDKQGIAYSLEGMGTVAVAQGNMKDAARIFGGAEALREAIGVPLSQAERGRQQETIESARGGLDPAMFDLEWQAGRTLPLSEIIAQVLE